MEEGDTIILHSHGYIGLMFSRYNTIMGYNYAAADASSVSAVDSNTFVPQGHSSVGKIPLGPLLFEPVAPQQEILDLVGHRHIGLKVMPVNDKRNHCATENIQARPIGCEQRILRRGQFRMGHQVSRND